VVFFGGGYYTGFDSTVMQP